MAQPVTLHSKEHGDLLDVVDKLRSLGISHHIDLPQVIVCGDQSSGKSSVLEALSGIRFPVKDTVGTRFATEVILRRGPLASVSLSVVTGTGQNDEGSGEPVDFQREDVDLDNIGDLMAEASKAMGIDGSSRNFSNDILRFEITGPSQPQLTLVDLPGLFQAGTKAQSLEDSQAVMELVLSYMRKTRSIILAVVTAKNDFANQIVTTYTRKQDPHGHRTLGVITKPDTLHVGSDSEREYFELAENKNVHLHHGWHILKNRDFDTRSSSTDERDNSEQVFFSEGIWSNLPRHHVGIASLRPRLSVLLKNQILEELPSLKNDVQRGIEGCRRLLESLGDSRATIQEQRVHLLRASERYTSLMTSAFEGSYNHGFFGDAAQDQGAQKRLRAIVQNTLFAFSESMRNNGHAKHIVETVSKKDRKVPGVISRSDMIDEVLILMRQSRGRELPGTYNPQIVGDLFRAQAAPWEGLVRTYLDKIWDAVKSTLDLILEYATDGDTMQGLKREIIEPGLGKIMEEAETTLRTVLEPNKHGHPITYNHYFTDNIQKSKNAYQRRSLMFKLDQFFGTKIADGNTRVEGRTFDARSLLDTLSQNTTADMDRYACSEAIDCMKAYYKVAIKTFVDDFSGLVVENQILKMLPLLLPSESVVLLDEDKVRSIAAETGESMKERRQTLQKLEALEQASSLLQKLERAKQPVSRVTHTETQPNASESESEDVQDDNGRLEVEDERPRGSLPATNGVATQDNEERSFVMSEPASPEIVSPAESAMPAAPNWDDLSTEQSLQSLGPVPSSRRGKKKKQFATS